MTSVRFRHERLISALDRIEAKIDVLQLETAHLRRVKYTYIVQRLLLSSSLCTIYVYLQFMDEGFWQNLLYAVLFRIEMGGLLCFLIF